MLLSVHYFRLVLLCNHNRALLMCNNGEEKWEKNEDRMNEKVSENPRSDSNSSPLLESLLTTRLAPLPQSVSRSLTITKGKLPISS